MQFTKFRGYKLFHQNGDAAESMIRQIDEFPSFFTPQQERPWIIDCGANIGVSVLEWKFRWPQSEVLCFEPDPAMFQLLQLNLERNDVPHVDCVQAAVSDQAGTATLYGEMQPGGDARGNSIDPCWGERPGGGSVTVPVTRLSSYIGDRTVSFLKLDVEGVEQRVLQDIAGQLSQIEAIYMEIHQTRASVNRNSSSQIQALLRNSGFKIECEPREGPFALPPQLDRWSRAVGASQIQLLAWR